MEILNINVGGMMVPLHTFESEWKGTEPNPADKFWKFRLPDQPREKDPYGSFHYFPECIGKLSLPLTIEDRVGLYSDLKSRRRNESPLAGILFDRETRALVIDTMDLIGTQVKEEVYSDSVFRALIFNPHPPVIEGLQIGERYREASLVYPGSDWPRTVYVKGEVTTPEGKIEGWMGPQDVTWHSADMVRERSGVFISPIEEGILYFWYFDKLADEVAKKASDLNFKPNIRLTPEQNIRIVYKR